LQNKIPRNLKFFFEKTGLSAKRIAERIEQILKLFSESYSKIKFSTGLYKTFANENLTSPLKILRGYEMIVFQNFKESLFALLS
jgi:hypothetical protein